MWVICKYKRNSFNFLKSNIKKKFSSQLKIYNPTIKYEKISKGKKVIIEENILENYCFLYHPSFNNNSLVSQLKYMKGIDFFVQGWKENQKQITNFLDYCKINENTDGFICQSFFSNLVNDQGIFLNGPFANSLFLILEKYKNKLKILVRDFQVTIDKNSNYLYRSL